MIIINKKAFIFDTDVIITEDFFEFLKCFAHSKEASGSTYKIYQEDDNYVIHEEGAKNV